MTANTTGGSPHPPQPTVLDRLIEMRPRRTWLTGLTFWGGAALALGLHACDLALPDPTRFSFLDAWLIGLGCLGCPVLAIRALGRRLTAQAYVLIGAVSFTIAVLLTALTLAGEMHPDAIDGTFGLILPLTLGVHAINATDVDRRGTRERATSYRQGRIDALTDTLEQRYAALAGLGRLEEMDLAGLRTLADIVTAHIAARSVEPRGLHLVSQSGERGPDREPITRRCAPSHHGAAEQRGSPAQNQPRRERGDLT